jgi:hypothetical protein
MGYGLGTKPLARIPVKQIRENTAFIVAVNAVLLYQPVLEIIMDSKCVIKKSRRTCSGHSSGKRRTHLPTPKNRIRLQICHKQTDHPPRVLGKRRMDRNKKRTSFQESHTLTETPDHKNLLQMDQRTQWGSGK